MATINLSEYKELNISNIETFKVAIVVAEWNAFITENLLKGCEETLLKEGVKQENIKIVRVPGAFELSYASMQLCKSQKYDAVVAIGCVIRGETAHFDFVCSGVTQGITLCNTQTDTPTIFCLLTDDHKEQSIARSGGSLGNKGIEAGVTALKMIDLRRQMK
jgi:6,7-dimethyl-8-ribityllumazine synthase